MFLTRCSFLSAFQRYYLTCRLLRSLQEPAGSEARAGGGSGGSDTGSPALRLPHVPHGPARVPPRLRDFAFSSSAAEKVPIPQFKGPTGPASMIDSLEKRTRVLKGGEEGGVGGEEEGE